MPKLKLPIARLAKYDDPREMPIYSIPEASHYLQIPEATLRTWVKGRKYKVAGGRTERQFQPVIKLPESRVALLSFYNLAEAHVLGAFRREHNVALQDIRKALRYVQRRFEWKRPLIDQRFQTDGASLFIEHLGELIDASAQGQKLMRGLIDAHLQRLRWEDSRVARLYPFTRARQIDSPKLVLIDPRYSFGRPVLAKSHISTSVLAERYKAGESVEDLVNDYGCRPLEVEEALRCELNIAAAA